MILVGASGDWTAKTMTRAFPTIRGVYSLIGSTDRIEAAVFDFPHNYNQASRNAVYAFMGRWLLGLGDPSSTREGQQQTEKPETLWTFDRSHPAPPNRKTAEQLETDLVRLLGVQIESLAPTRIGSTNWDAARRFLMVSLRNRVNLVNPPPETIDDREVRRLSREGFTIVHSQIGRRLRGEAIPLVRLIPTRSTGRLTVIADSRGKARGHDHRPAFGDGSSTTGRGPECAWLRSAVRRRVDRSGSARGAPSRYGALRDLQSQPGRRPDAGPGYRAELGSLASRRPRGQSGRAGTGRPPGLACPAAARRPGPNGCGPVRLARLRWLGDAPPCP